MARNDRYVRSVEQMSRADQREARTGMRQSFGAMIAKIATGLMFIFICFDDSEDGLSFGATMVGICMGGALLAWGLLPYLGARRKRRERQAAEEAARTAQILNAPLHKFSDNGGVSDEALNRLEKQYGGASYEEVKPAAARSGAYRSGGSDGNSDAPASGIDWNRDGQLDWQDAAIEKEILRKEATRRGLKDE